MYAFPRRIFSRAARRGSCPTGWQHALFQSARVRRGWVRVGFRDRVGFRVRVRIRVRVRVKVRVSTGQVQDKDKDIDRERRKEMKAVR